MGRRMSWGAFEDRLARSLAQMPDASYLVVEERSMDGQENSWFVQFARVPDGFLAEAVSNLYLNRWPRLSPAQEAAMASLGWEAPRPRSKHHRNYQRRFEASDGFTASVAALAVRTLREVQGVASPDDLAYHRFLRNGGDLPDPGLGLLSAKAAGAWWPSLEEFDEVVRAGLEAWDRGEVVRKEPGLWMVDCAPSPVRLVRLDTEPPMLRVYQVFLGKVTASEELLGRINRANTALLVGRVLLVDDVLIFGLEVSADHLTKTAVRRSCNEVVKAAKVLGDEFRRHLAAELPQPAGAVALPN